MDDQWRRLSHRVTNDAEALHEGLHGHIFAAVEGWFVKLDWEELSRRVALRTRVTWAPSDRINLLRAAVTESDERGLDVLDSVLYECATHFELDASDYADPLDEVLALGGSAWRVNTARNGLEARLSPGAREAIDIAVANAGTSSAGPHLTAAFRNAYGRNPNPSAAYSESIKAVEAAAAPVVTPNDLKSTLGRIIGEMRSARSVYQAALSPGDPAIVVAMMSALWDGQTDRHGGPKPTVAISATAGQAAVHLAATLVQWFAAGQIGRV